VLLLLVLPISVPRIWRDGLQAIPDLQANPQFNASIFWCCVLYSLTSLPFFPFMISGLQEVMTHCYASGFNQHGACVAYEGVPANVEECVAEPSGPRPARLLPGQTFALGVASRGLKLMQSGAEYRGETSALNLRATDLFRGIWHENVVKRWRRASEGQPEEGGEEVAELEDGGYDYGEQMYFSIAYASIPANKMQEDFGGEAAFFVEVATGLGLDGEAAATSDMSAYAYNGTDRPPTVGSSGYSNNWYVVRHFHEFEALADRLGPRCKKFPNAPFPAGPRLGAVKGNQLEQRRSQLEDWLTQVMKDEKCCHDRWNKQMTDFLTKDSWHQTDINRLMRQSGGERKNLAQKISEGDMPGPVERAQPLARVAKSRGPVFSLFSCTSAPARLATFNFDEGLEG